ncbi:NAD(P)/FAD-dependent oxidoreductase [Streptomyces atroolivaceus]|uniref:NAD(P)/FAD-dependent oxidoreductase n=1 Tax=Streptomyces atroolivaceus TaxID=66869 RepID=UPI0036620966
MIGAGIAGLLCARVLSETFTRVTIIERDTLNTRPQPRRGVPQGQHAHALQARGLQAFEELLPGIQGALTAAGAPLADFCRAGRLQLPYGSPPPMDSGIHIRMVSRPLLETIVRAEILRIAHVRIRDGCTVTGLVLSGDRRRATGVRLLQRSPAGQKAPTEVLPADLVADAAGRSSHLPRWFTDLGLPQVAETTVDAHMGYASRVYRAAPANWLALFEIPQAPSVTRGAFALRTEDGRLLVSLQGAAGDHPPGADPGFETFAKSLASGLYGIMRDSEPVTPVVRYARTTNLRRHYHRLPSWPGGLIVLGDAVCAFNPVYAQGMTVAALEVLELRRLLTGRGADPLDEVAVKFQRRLARITAWPWAIATLPDRAWQNKHPPLAFRLGLWYLDQWYKCVPTDRRMYYDIARITNMTSSPSLLFHPRHIAHIIAMSVLRQRRRSTSPQE